MLFLETPTNPMLRITDLRAASEIAHAHDVFVVVDNTFASPYIQRPLEFGADIVVHSTTKFLNGHSDSVGGVVVAVSATSTSSGCGSSRTPRARSSGRWTRGWCCAAPRR